MIYHYEIDGLPVQTGDIVCTSDGTVAETDIRGQFWRLLGKLIPGDIDHIIVYIGPEGRCAEIGAKGKVIAFEVKDHTWDYKKMFTEREIMDTLYGIVYPLHNVDHTEAEITRIREAVADYCLEQVRLQRPYNFNFLDSSTEDAFYCSQLAYQAYIRHGIDLNTGENIPKIPGTDSIIFPQEIWNGFHHVKA